MAVQKSVRRLLALWAHQWAHQWVHLGTRLSAAAGRTRPWQRWALAFGSGALTTLALAPFNIIPVLALAFTCLVWQLDHAAALPKPMRAAAAIGWWFGFGYHLAGLHWMGFAFLVEAETYAWMIPFVALAMPGGLALFTAVAAALVRLSFDQVQGAARLVAFAVLWMMAEWLRGTILTGFPWNLIGYSWVSVLPVAQGAALMGVYGLSFLTLLLAGAPAGLFFSSRSLEQGRVPGGFGLLGFMVVVFVGLGLWGHVRMADDIGANEFVTGVRLRIVQPAVPQKDKWEPQNRSAIFENYLRLTEAKSAVFSNAPTHVIWPESAVPFFFDRQPAALERAGRALAPGAHLVTGAARMEEGSPRRYFNAVHVINSEGKITRTYDKYHLVPFGEYLPFKGLLSRLGFEQMAQSAGGFDKGPGPRTLNVGGQNILPLICYEVIFPGQISSGLKVRPDWMLNVTNDAWFGTTTGPHQHFTQSRFRAIEEGVTLVRAANTGISGVIDAHGQVRASLGLGQKGILDVPLPAALPITPYGRWGDATFWLLMLVASAFVGAARKT